MRGYPRAEAGNRIGLLGGSFDPAHQGHVHISQLALKSFGLDRVWWLVSPGNPLKARPPADMERRLGYARNLATHPRIVVTDVERRMGTRLTADTITALQERYQDVQFVWLMGSDNLRGFHRWDRWSDILEMVPVGVLARPGEQLAAGGSRAARAYAAARLPARRSQALSTRVAPCWCLQTGPMVDLSSTEIRAQGAWT